MALTPNFSDFQETLPMNTTLATSYLPAVRSNWVLQALMVVAGSLFLAISAQIQVPFWPVPVTMQTLAVLLIGIAFGPIAGAASVLLYLAEGAAGLPVFAGLAGGPSHFAGPTGGYLAAFPIAAAIVGWMTQGGKGAGWMRALAACLIAEVVIFGLGYAWLGKVIGYGDAWTYGVQPFLLGDGVKSVIAALLAQTAWRNVARDPGV
jgi:biotin transport system substrate-specific component